MELPDTEDLALMLTYKHVKSLGMKDLRNQIFKLGVKAGLDLESVDCQTSVQDVIQAYKSFESKSKIQPIDEQTNHLVYSYLNRANHSDIADEFARICMIQKDTKLPYYLESVIDSEKFPSPQKLWKKLRITIVITVTKS